MNPNRGAFTPPPQFATPSPQICVSECPDRFLTLLGASGDSSSMEYYRQFCVPELGTTSMVPWYPPPSPPISPHS